jgi:hypothetical protein
MKSLNWSFRLKASLIHLCACAIVATIVAIVVFALWYPGDYRKMSGGTELFLLVTSVDVTIGPLITLVIFNKNKPLNRLRLDVAIIVVLQLAAFSYGLYMVSISRPVVLALEEDRFRVVARLDVYMPELDSASPEYKNLSLTGPQLVRSPLPTDPQLKSDALVIAMHGYDIGSRPSLWKPWDTEARNVALAHAKPIETLMQRYPTRQNDIDVAIRRTGKSIDKLVYLPMLTFREDWVALLDRSDGGVVGFAPFDGF